MKKKRYSEEQIICPHCFTKNRTTLMILKRVLDDKDNESSNAEREILTNMRIPVKMNALSGNK